MADGRWWFKRVRSRFDPLYNAVIAIVDLVGPGPMPDGGHQTYTIVGEAEVNRVMSSTRFHEGFASLREFEQFVFPEKQP